MPRTVCKGGAAQAHRGTALRSAATPAAVAPARPHRTDARHNKHKARKDMSACELQQACDQRNVYRGGIKHDMVRRLEMCDILRATGGTEARKAFLIAFRQTMSTHTEEQPATDKGRSNCVAKMLLRTLLSAKGATKKGAFRCPGNAGNMHEYAIAAIL